jgi:hypothetical protein
MRNPWTVIWAAIAIGFLLMALACAWFGDHEHARAEAYKTHIQSSCICIGRGDE